MSEAPRSEGGSRRESEDAEKIYSEFQERRDRGEPADFEQLCREHHDLEVGLRLLNSLHGQRGEPGSAGITRSVSPERGESPPSEGIFPRSEAPRDLPERIGRYRVLQFLGEGGMGVVYLAEQTEPIRRRAALKVIKRGMDTKEVIARFEAERQALALMSHPSIARVYDAGSTPDGRPFFAMEYVPGEPITEYSDRHRLSNRERLKLFTQVCDAVQHAHQKAIIHRDLKSSNVLVMVQDGKPLPKIIDFGVAKATNQRLTEKTVFTELGQIIGTPEYMSPEQAEMGILDIDTRTDIYSLGVLLYELLTGVLPFSSEELRRVITASRDGTVRIWPVDVQAAALERKPRELNPAEAERFQLGRSQK